MCINSFFIKMFSSYIGKDQFGNRYYSSGEKRYVIYNGKEEPSKVPPIWHAWLHHLKSDKPNYNDIEGYIWQKKYEPNQTGTKKAHHYKRKIISSDYSPWRPS